MGGGGFLIASCKSEESVFSSGVRTPKMESKICMQLTCSLSSPPQNKRVGGLITDGMQNHFPMHAWKQSKGTMTNDYLSLLSFFLSLDMILLNHSIYRSQTPYSYSEH